MDDGSGIDFGDALEYPGFEFLEGLYPDMPQKASSHLAEKRLDDVEPRAMRGCQDVLKTVGARGEKSPRLFGNVRGMIVEYDSDGAFRRIPRVQIRQQADEFDAAVTVLHACRDVPVLQIQRCQYGNRAEPLV